MDGVQAAAEAANNASTRPVTELACTQRLERQQLFGVPNHLRTDSCCPLIQSDDAVVWSHPLGDLDSDIITCSSTLNWIQVNLHGFNIHLEVRRRAREPDSVADREISREFESCYAYLPKIAVDATDFLL